MSPGVSGAGAGRRRRVRAPCSTVDRDSRSLYARPRAAHRGGGPRGPVRLSSTLVRPSFPAAPFVMTCHDSFVDFDPEEMPARSCSVSGTAEGLGVFTSHSGGRSRFGRVRVSLGPHSGPHMYRFIWPASLNRHLPEPFMREACLAGVRRALRDPLDDGSRALQAAVSIVEGNYHEHTDAHSMEFATYLAVREALSQVSFAYA